jgi:AmmeMemoRadiSam system protein B
MRRRPAVAGTFYPAEREDLRRLMDLLCGEGSGEKEKAKGVLVPHAGYVYSGRTACRVYSRILIPERVVLIGPNHTGMGADVSLYPGEVWETPFGDVEVDGDLKALLLETGMFEADDLAHIYEHSLEVQLPFLIRFAPRPFTILPIVVRHLDYDRARDLGRRMGEALKNAEVLIVISSDMSHYIEAGEARRKDMILISAMERLRTDELYFKAVQYNITMCGFVPAVVGLEALKVLGAREGILVDYTNSGDTTGDYEKVVAYAGMIFV